MMTLKTLRYSHEKTCGIIPETKPKKEKPKTKVIIQEVEEIQHVTLLPKKLKPELIIEPIKTLKELRIEHLKDRVKNRTVRIEKLFEQAF